MQCSLGILLKLEQTLHPYRLRKAQLLMSAPSCLLAILIAFAIGAGREKVKIGYMVDDLAGYNPLLCVKNLL